MHKFAVIHKLSGIVCYSTNREIRFEPGFNYEIVSNSAELKTVTPDLTFNSYAEIADAVNLSDKLVFTKDSDDNLIIADNARNIVIPALLFKETCLDVEEVALGDVEELMEDYGFNSACTELLARNAVKFWVASRFLELSPTETTPTETTPTETTPTETTPTETTPTETTHVVKVVADSLEIYESGEFEGELAFAYKGDEYLLADFMTTNNNNGWHGVMGLSYFSAYYVHLNTDDTLTLGYAHW